MSNALISASPDLIALQSLLAAREAELAAERSARLVLEAELAEAKADLTIRHLLIEKLKLQIARLRRMALGQSSEKLKGQIEQLELALEELETAEAIVAPKPARLFHLAAGQKCNGHQAAIAATFAVNCR